MSGRKVPVASPVAGCKPDPPPAPPRRVRPISDEEFLAAGLERYGRRFFEMMRDIPPRPALWAPGAPPPRPEPTARACAAAGRQFVDYLEAERIAARVEVALGALEPRASRRFGLQMLARTIMRFQPSRSGLTICPRD